MCCLSFQPCRSSSFCTNLVVKFDILAVQLHVLTGKKWHMSHHSPALQNETCVCPWLMQLDCWHLNLLSKFRTIRLVWFGLLQCVPALLAFVYLLCSVTSSEKADKENRYSDFTIISLPYPGCEFFKEYRDNDYVAKGLVFDWTQSHVDAVIGVPKDAVSSQLKIDWEKYKVMALCIVYSNRVGKWC